MPRATVDLNDTRRVDLKTCPGGFVTLRRLSYGQKLQRQQLSMELSMTGDPKAKGKDAELGMRMTQERVAAFEFGNCIVDHNLEDDKGNKLDFRQPLNVMRLDPRIGEEIDNHISDMNNFEDDQGNSETGSEQVS